MVRWRNPQLGDISKVLHGSQWEQHLKQTSNISISGLRDSWHRWRNQLWNGAMRCQALLRCQISKSRRHLYAHFCKWQSHLTLELCKSQFLLAECTIFHEELVLPKEKIGHRHRKSRVFGVVWAWPPGRALMAARAKARTHSCFSLE